MYSLILCGGSGTRLWPLSRKNFPKQFLNLYGENSLIQETYLRMKELTSSEKIYFITNKANFFNVYNQIRNIEKDFNKEQILIEPDSLNTAPALTFAIKHLLENVKINPDEHIIVAPSDHFIINKKDFVKTISNFQNEIKDQIGTIGITPSKPETGFGYIKKGLKTDKSFYKVEEFVEKPNKETAKSYLESGQYVWNSGIYIFSSKTFVRETKKHAPEIYKLLTLDFNQFIENYSKMPNISLDFAISEKSNNIIVCESRFEWSDIGSFDSLAEISEKNKTRHLFLDSKNIFVNSTSDKLIATIGVENLNIIETSDCILVQKQGQAEKVKDIVKELKKRKAKELNDSVIVYRPWGSFEVLIDTPTYKVKKIVVYPGAKLSLQAHHHRAEHWTVVRGMAEVTNGEKKLFLHENESTFIPVLTTHRLQNPGKINIEMIEVQTGNYLEEDDIIRYDDEFGRVDKS